jgi:hypothetical protein
MVRTDFTVGQPCNLQQHHRGCDYYLSLRLGEQRTQPTGQPAQFPRWHPAAAPGTENASSDAHATMTSWARDLRPIKRNECKGRVAGWRSRKCKEVVICLS